MSQVVSVVAPADGVWGEVRIKMASGIVLVFPRAKICHEPTDESAVVFSVDLFSLEPES